jgi:hypothetical protein
MSKKGRKSNTDKGLNELIKLRDDPRTMILFDKKASSIIYLYKIIDKLGQAKQ